MVVFGQGHGMEDGGIIEVAGKRVVKIVCRGI